MPNSIDEIYIVYFINDTIGTHGQKMRGTRFENGVVSFAKNVMLIWFCTHDIYVNGKWKLSTYFDRFLFLEMNK